MTFEQLQSILISGESSTVEFKTEDVRSESLAGEIVSMANLAGGVILIGVEDNGTVQGVAAPALPRQVGNPLPRRPAQHSDP